MNESLKEAVAGDSTGEGDSALPYVLSSVVVVCGFIYFGIDSFYSQSTVEWFAHSLMWLLPLLCVLGLFVLLGLGYRRRSTTAADHTVPARKADDRATAAARGSRAGDPPPAVSPVTRLAMALAGAILMGLAILTIATISGLVIVRATSVNAVRFTSEVTIQKGIGAGCAYYVTFYDAPIQRDVRTCAEDRGIAGAKSGDTLVIDENIGPVGAYLNGVHMMAR